MGEIELSRDAGAPAGRPPLLEAVSIHKRYGHVTALRGADFAAEEGRIVALIGDNGAGKSTLVKILCGVLEPDSGEIRIDGVPVRFRDPQAAHAAGIEAVFQDLAVAPDLDAVTNVFLGREICRRGPLGRLGVLDRRRMRRDAVAAFGDLGVSIADVTRPVSLLSGGQRQSVAAVRAALWASRIIIFDEPTAALGVQQTERVQALIRRLRDAGLAVVLISHDMAQVVELADRVEVLRLGQRACRFERGAATAAALVAAMTGTAPAEAQGAAS